MSEANEAIRVLVADSSRMASQMLVDTLLRNGRFQPLGAPLSPDDFASAVQQLNPHIAIIGIGPNGSQRKGLDLIRFVRAKFPELRAVVLLDSLNNEVIVEAFRSGVDGVICRDDSIDTLIKCLGCVYAGQIWANSAQLRLVLQVLSQQSVPRTVVDANGTSLLSKRELDVIRGVAEGRTNREIATHLKLSEHTVKNYLFHVFEKLGVSNRTELLAFVLSHTSYIDKATEVKSAISFKSSIIE
jgi:DNA-binding NarL/FixJ family response regulator